MTAEYNRDWTLTTSKKELYLNSVSGTDADSQARFGTRTNEVTGLHKTYFFDMLTTASGAQATLDKILADKAVPRKIVTIETDWRHSDLEPSDIIEINSELLLEPIRGRIIEQELDPRLFSRFTAREVGPV